MEQLKNECITLLSERAINLIKENFELKNKVEKLLKEKSQFERYIDDLQDLNTFWREKYEGKI